MSIDTSNCLEQVDDMGVKFTLKERDPARFDALSEFLDQVTAPAGFAYKDVVQPFVVAEWLRSHPHQYRVLRIKRRLPDVAFAMLAKRWLYPCRAAPDSCNRRIHLSPGLFGRIGRWTQCRVSTFILTILLPVETPCALP